MLSDQPGAFYSVARSGSPDPGQGQHETWIPNDFRSHVSIFEPPIRRIWRSDGSGQVVSTFFAFLNQTRSITPGINGSF